jgi:hypothetical protein
MKRVTVAEAAAILGVSVDAVRKRLQRGTLAGEKQGKTWYVTLQQDATGQATGHRQDMQNPSSRETVGAAGREQDTDRTFTGHRQDNRQDATVGGDPARSLEVLQVELESARGLLALTEEQLAAAREEANFLRERITAQEAIIAQLAEAQTEAWRRRDVLEAQSRAALPAGRKRWWWPWGKA